MRSIAEGVPPAHMKQWACVHRTERVSVAYEPVDSTNSYRKRLTKLEKRA